MAINQQGLEDFFALREMLRTKSLKKGPVTLASGIKSDVYLDARLTTYTAEGMRLVGRVCVHHLQEIGLMPPIVGGMVRGATPVSMAIAYESNTLGLPINVIMFQKELPYSDEELKGLEILKGLSVVIVEDTVSTGTSIADCIVIAKSVGMNVLGALCLVDRQMGAKEKLLAEHTCELHSLFELSELTG